jgi:hypothetical protein
MFGETPNRATGTVALPFFDCIVPAKWGWIHWPARIKSRRRFRSSNEMLLLLSMVIQPSKMTDRITPDSLREMANPLRPTGNCFSIGLIDGTLRLHASGPRLILPGLESCSLLNGRILLQPPSGQKRSAHSPPQQEERVGERRLILLDAPLPVPLPARSSRGEGEEDFRWL